MTHPGELHRLASWDTRPQFTLSLYLSLDQSREGRLQTINQLYKNAEQRLKGNGSTEALEELDHDLRQATRFVEELPMGPGRGLALFSCQGQEKFSAYTLPILVPNRMEVGPSPYIRPLTALLSDYRHTLIVVVDQRRARIFNGFLGELKELPQLEVNTEAISQERDGDQGRAGDSRLSRKAGENKNRHYREVAAALMDALKTQPEHGLLIGGPKASVEALVAVLHPYVAGRLAGVFSCEAGASLAQVSQAVAEAQEESRRVHQKKALASLEENLGRLAATGLNQVLAALYEGQVHTLLVSRGFSAPGGSCPECGRLRHEAGVCPLCGGEMTRVQDVVNLALIKALGQGAALEQIEGESRLDELGSIAALLRYA